MKLLFDQNLSYRLVKSFAAEFPGSAHVRHVGLEKALDGSVWDYAKENGSSSFRRTLTFTNGAFFMVTRQRWFGFAAATAQRQPLSQYFASTKMI